MKTRIKLIIFLLFLIGTFSSNLFAQSKKTRVAVLTFEDKTDGRGRWWHYKNVGDGVTDMIVTSLVENGKYSIMERTRIDALIKEQKLGMSGFMAEESVAQIGKLLGVDLAIMGAVSEFGYTNDQKGIRLGGKNIGVGKQSAVVAIDLRIVDIKTGEILAAKNVRKEDSSNSVSFRSRKLDFKDQKQFDESLVGKATRKAVDEIVEVILNQDIGSGSVTYEAKDATTKVITFKEGKVYINKGATGGIKVGDTFVVYKQGEALIDPDTGLNLGSLEEKVGKIKVINNAIGDGKASICEVIEGTDFGKGYLVKEK